MHGTLPALPPAHPSLGSLNALRLRPPQPIVGGRERGMFVRRRSSPRCLRQVNQPDLGQGLLVQTVDNLRDKDRGRRVSEPATSERFVDSGRKLWWRLRTVEQPVRLISSGNARFAPEPRAALRLRVPHQTRIDSSSRSTNVGANP